MIGGAALARALSWRPGGPARPLAASERGLLPPALAAGVDLDRIRIVRGWHSPLAALLRLSIARGPRIFWAHAPHEATRLEERAHLAHELTHVWQYLVLRRTGPELLADRRYRYALRDARPFVGYGYEQQAAIVEDYIRLRDGAPTRWATSTAPLARYDALFELPLEGMPYP